MMQNTFCFHMSLTQPSSTPPHLMYIVEYLVLADIHQWVWKGEGQSQKNPADKVGVHW